MEAGDIGSGAYQGAGSEKKIRKKIVKVHIYVFVDSEQKAAFKTKIEPCSH